MNQQVQPLLSPDLPSSRAKNAQPGENCSFEDVASNVKILLKLIHDQKGSGRKGNDESKYHRVAGMISIIDEVKSRIETIQSSKKVAHELRRCNTELKPRVPKDKKPLDHHDLGRKDDKERMRRELSSSLMTRKSLQAMCSSLGKEKQILASQLARKAQELTEMEEFIADLKAQNEMLMEKLKASTLEPEKRSYGDVEIMKALQVRNKLLSEQLQKSLDGYRFLKKKFKEKQEENLKIHATMEEMQVEVQVGINRIHGVKEQTVATNEETDNIKEQISALQNMLESLNVNISKHCQKKSLKCSLLVSEL